jgi:3-phenylpropionate/cinnamic acid dioxygenase small subunit
MFDYRVVEQFLYKEARFMDEHRYADWLALWAEDAHYWIPCKDDDGGLDRTIAIVNEGRAGIEDRIKRLQGGAHYAQDPKSRLSRIVSNIEIVEERDGGLVVSSTFNLTASRKGRIDIVAGRVTHKLHFSEGDFRIAGKKVLLANNDEVMTNLTYLV